MFLNSIYISKILYFFPLLVLVSGLFIMLTSDNYVRKLIGLSIMQASVLIFYLLFGKISGGIIPIERSFPDNYNYSSPVPQVLMLTAVVVGFATLSVGLSLIYRIFQQFNTISENAVNSSRHHTDDKTHASLKVMKEDRKDVIPASRLAFRKTSV